MTASYKSDRFLIPQFPGDAALVVPSDSTVYNSTTNFPDGISVLVTVTGNLTLTPLSGATDIVLLAWPAGSVIPFRVSKVKAATTAACVAIA